MGLRLNEEVWRPKPGVINEEMIRHEIRKMLQDDIPGNNIDEQEGYELHDITHLHLEHLDILQIDHLWMMPALTVLKLTGNLLIKIENLDMLVNLVDLNLSFNKIRKIENLEKLVKLRHLSLYCNLIDTIENLESLQELKIFTIGDNKIDDKQCCLLLRKLNLFSLNMADNPCTTVEGFRYFVAAFLPKLQFYEYKKVTEEERERGRSLYQTELQELEREENKAEIEAEKAKAQAEKEALHAKAFVEGLDQDQLYDLMMEGDPSGQALLLLGDEVIEIYNTFKEQIGQATTEIFNLGLQQLDLRNKEIEMFNEGVGDAIMRSRTKQREVLENFLERKSDVFIEISGLYGDMAREVSEDDSLKKGIESEVKKVTIFCASVKRELLNLELILSEQLKEVFANFERSLGDMVNSFIESSQGFFTIMREHETVFSEQVGDYAGRFLTQLTVRNEDVSSLQPPLRPVMGDKDMLNTALASSHDVHLQVIDNREDQLMSRIRTWYQKLCNDLEQEEITRFRGRINEIINFLALQTTEFQLYNLPVDEDLYALNEEAFLN